MKKYMRHYCRTVQAKSEQAFDKRFAQVSEELQEKDVELVWDSTGMCVHFHYTEPVYVPESVKEEYELKGCSYHCKDCPYFIKGKNGKYKSAGCMYEPDAVDYTEACEKFYREMATGKIKPVEG